MFNRAEKIALIITGTEIVVGTVICVTAYAKAQYYQGRVDASKEVLVKTIKLVNAVNRLYGDLDEEA